MSGSRRHGRIGRLAIAGLMCLCALAVLPGCKRQAAEDPEAPVRLLLHLRDLQHDRSYKEMASLVEPGRARVLIDTLMAMDRLLLASTQLQQTAERRLGPRAAVICNLAGMADYLGPFSRKVDIVSSRIEGETATVVYQVGERVPVERAELRRTPNGWRYAPDDPDYALPDLLRQLTDAMIRLHRRVEVDACTEEVFIEEYTRQVLAPLQAHIEKTAGR